MTVRPRSGCSRTPAADAPVPHPAAPCTDPTTPRPGTFARSWRARPFLTNPLGFSNPGGLSYSACRKTPSSSPRPLAPGPPRRPQRRHRRPGPGRAGLHRPPGRRRLRRLGQPGGLLDTKARLQRPGRRLRQDEGGRGHHVSSSFGPSGTQATSVVDGLPADIVNFSLDARHDQGGQGRPGVELVGSQRHQGHGDELHRLVHRAPGESQAHHHLGRPH